MHCAMGAAGWETEYLKVRQAVCSHIAETNTYTGIKGNMYLANTKMALVMTEGMDVELMVASQMLGINIHIYHKMGKEYEWQKFLCMNGVASLAHKAMYLYNHNGIGNSVWLLDCLCYIYIVFT